VLVERNIYIAVCVCVAFLKYSNLEELSLRFDYRFHFSTVVKTTCQHNRSAFEVAGRLIE